VTSLLVVTQWPEVGVVREVERMRCIYRREQGACSLACTHHSKIENLGILDAVIATLPFLP
jgi:hypothetical protein